MIDVIQAFKTLHAMFNTNEWVDVIIHATADDVTLTLINMESMKQAVVERATDEMGRDLEDAQLVLYDITDHKEVPKDVCYEELEEGLWRTYDEVAVIREGDFVKIMAEHCASSPDFQILLQQYEDGEITFLDYNRRQLG